MRKSLAAIATIAALGCTTPARPGHPGTDAPLQAVDAQHLPFYNTLLEISEVPPQDAPGHLRNLERLVSSIRENKGITPEMPRAEQLRHIHDYLFDQNAIRHAADGRAEDIFTLAQPHRIIQSDLTRAERRIGSSLGLALEYQVIAQAFGFTPQAHLYGQGTLQRIVLVSDGQLFDPTAPHGTIDAPLPLANPLTNENLTGLLLHTKGMHALINGNTDHAYRLFDAAFFRYQNAEIATNLGETALIRGVPALADAWFDQASALDDSLPIPHERRGDIAYARGDLNAAQGHFMHALERCSTSGTLYAKYGETLFMLGQTANANVFFRRAMELEPNNERLKAAIAQYTEVR